MMIVDDKGWMCFSHNIDSARYRLQQVIIESTKTNSLKSMNDKQKQN